MSDGKRWFIKILELKKARKMYVFYVLLALTKGEC